MIVRLQTDAKWQVVHNTRVEDTFAGSRAGLQLGIDLANIRILAEQLQAFRELIDVQRRAIPAIETIGDKTVTQPMVAAHFNPRNVPFNNAKCHYAVRG